MKVRIQRGSIRYRLKQPEVESFKNTGVIIEVLQLGSTEDEKLSFALQRSSVNEVSVQNIGKSIIVYVPEILAMQWTDTNEVGFETSISISNGSTINVLVEKDFECLDGSEEENVGAYPNPSKVC